ncbi:MAG: DUF1295 domain-containing protein [Chthoniobacterales bacterium]|nr:DUF1295 domain-containing protein [Chthoniobacterales bacterium]
MHPLPLFFEGTALIIFLFILAWSWARYCDNYSLVDAFWSAGIGLIAILFLLGPGAWNQKKGIIGFLVATWSVRLSWHLSYRIAKHHPQEDRRYQNLRDAWKNKEQLFSFLFFQAQALSVLLLALPFLLIGIDQNPGWDFLEIAGCSLLTIAILGEAIADKQLADFKKNELHNSAICQQGIWKYSRHPNYFFESLVWMGFYLIIAGSPNGWISFYAPGAIIFLLVKITGIPPAEASSLRSKGEAYRQYQKNTSIFIPWFPKK